MMMKTKCPLCKETKTNFLKEIDKINIYECRFCKLAIIPVNKKAKKNIYNFNLYNTRKSFYIKRFKKIVNRILRYKNNGDVLDVGGGYGLFANELKKKKFKVEVIEPNQSLNYSKTIRHYKTTLQEFVIGSKKKYDIITLMDVFEHFNDPKKIIIKLKSLLKTDGLLVIQTPNYKSLMAKIVNNWSWWMLEDHKVIFSKKSLNYLLTKGGFEILETNTYEDFIDFKKNLDGNFVNIKNNLVRKLVKLFTFYLFFPFYFFSRIFLWKLGYGGLIFSISKKQ